MSNRKDRYQEPPDRPRRPRGVPRNGGAAEHSASKSSAKSASRKPFSYADALSTAKATSTSVKGSGKTETLRVRTSSTRTSTRDMKKNPSKSSRKGKTSNPKRRSQISVIIDQFPHLASLNQKFDASPKRALFFVIKSYGEDDVHKSIKYGLWSSTPKGNRKLNARFEENLGRFGENHRQLCPIYLLFSVNQSKCFCGLARMETTVDFDRSFHAWAQDGKWTGHFGVRWLFIKDVPNGALRRIILPNNENKPVTFSRDTQEVPLEQGRAFLKIFMAFRPRTSILDDFGYYDTRQADMERERHEQNEKKRREEEERAARERGRETEEDEPFYETAPPTFDDMSGVATAAAAAQQQQQQQQQQPRYVYEEDVSREIDDGVYLAPDENDDHLHYYSYQYDNGNNAVQQYEAYDAPPRQPVAPPPRAFGQEEPFVVPSNPPAPPPPVVPPSTADASTRMGQQVPPPPPVQMIPPAQQQQQVVVPQTRPIAPSQGTVQQGIVQATPPTSIVYAANVSNGLTAAPVGQYYANGQASTVGRPVSQQSSGAMSTSRAPMSWAARAGAGAGTTSVDSTNGSGVVPTGAVGAQQGYVSYGGSLPGQQQFVNMSYAQANQNYSNGVYYPPQQGQQYQTQQW